MNRGNSCGWKPNSTCVDTNIEYMYISVKETE